MKLFLYFGLLLSVFVACEQSINDENQHFPVIINLKNFHTENRSVNEEQPIRESFELQYIGGYQDSVFLFSNMSSYFPPPPPPPPPSPPHLVKKSNDRSILEWQMDSIKAAETYKKWEEGNALISQYLGEPTSDFDDQSKKSETYLNPSKLKKSSDFKIIIDTTQVISNHYQFGVLSPKFPSYPILIKNGTKESIAIGVEGMVSLVKEAKNEDGLWQQVNEPFMFFCGNGLSFLFIKPNEIAITSTLIQDGDFETEFRLRMGNFVSNTYRGRMNRSQFIGS